MKTKTLLPAVFCLLLTVLLPLSAAPFSNLYFFGDSLTDAGNINNLTLGTYPGSPYYDGRFSNGPVWAETFASLMGQPHTSKAAGMTLGPGFFNIEISGDGGNNYSIAGARTDTSGALDDLGVPTGLLWQVYYYSQKSAAADPNALYVLFGGGNDLRDASLLGETERTAAAVGAAQNVAVAAYSLSLRGAKNFLVLNAPNIGNTPEARIVRNNAAAATSATIAYNSALGFFFDYLPSLMPGATFYQFNTYSLFEVLYQDALGGGALSGISNATTPCFAGYAGSTGANCATSLFADDIHPTANTHALLGYFAYDAVSGVAAPAQARMASFQALAMIENPEPASLVMVASGLALIALVRRRRAPDRY